MGEKKRGLWNRLLALDVEASRPPPEVVNDWLAPDRRPMESNWQARDPRSAGRELQSFAQQPPASQWQPRAPQPPSARAWQPSPAPPAAGDPQSGPVTPPAIRYPELEQPPAVVGPIEGQGPPASAWQPRIRPQGQPTQAWAPGVQRPARNEWQSGVQLPPTRDWQPSSRPSAMDDDGDGVLITELPHGSPLSLAGVCIGDIVVAVNGQPTPDENQLARVFSGLRPGQPATLTLARGGRQVTAVVEAPD